MQCVHSSLRLYLHARTSKRQRRIPHRIGEHSIPAEAATKSRSFTQHWQPPLHLQYDLHWAQKARRALRQPSSLPASLPGRARPALWRSEHVTIPLLQAERAQQEGELVGLSPASGGIGIFWPRRLGRSAGRKAAGSFRRCPLKTNELAQDGRQLVNGRMQNLREECGEAEVVVQSIAPVPRPRSCQCILTQPHPDTSVRQGAARERGNTPHVELRVGLQEAQVHPGQVGAEAYKWYSAQRAAQDNARQARTDHEEAWKQLRSAQGAPLSAIAVTSEPQPTTT